MRQFIFHLSSLLLLTFVSFCSVAQSRDTIYLTGQTAAGKADSISVIISQNLVAQGKVVINKNDTIPFKVTQYSKPDLYLKSDSVYKKIKKDSLFKKSDSLYKKTKLHKIKTDSVYKAQAKLFKKSAFDFQRSRRLDSLKGLNWKTDSIRIKGNLQRLKSDLQRIKEDSARRNKNLQKKVISMEVSCPKNGTVSLVNMGRKLIIKTINAEKVKLETTIFAQADFKPKDIDWQQTMNILVEKNKNKIEIRRTNTKPVKAGHTINDANKTDGKNNVTEPEKYRVDNKSPLTVYVPPGVKLEIESRYNELTIMNNLVSVELDLTNTNLQMLDADKAVIKSRYGSVKAGAIKEADIDLLNCKFFSGNLDKLKINSKYSTVTFQNSRTIDIKSLSDQYHIAKADNITASKSFGKLNIDQLGNSIQLTGSSADLEIRTIDATAKLVQVNNKYADVKLPVVKLLNYTVKFDGINSNVFTPFEKIRTVASDSPKNSPTVFNTAFAKTVGDVKNDFTAFVVNCASCSVDFR